MTGLDQIREFLDRLAHQFTLAMDKESIRWGRPTCDGCDVAGCCYLLTTMTLPEALVLAEHVHDWEGFKTPEDWRRIRSLGEEQEGVGRIPWFNSGVPCLFLNQKKRCDVYPARPMPCRAYFVWSPREDCLPAGIKPVLQADDGLLLRYLLTFSLEVQQKLGLDDGRVYIGSLPRMLGLALEALNCETEDEFVQIFRNEPFSLPAGFRDWIEGQNPFARQVAIPLEQLEAAKRIQRKKCCP